MFTAIDPGVHATGVAHFDFGYLHAVRLVPGKTLEEMLRAFFLLPMSAEMIIERPTGYGKGKSDPDDLIRGALVAGAASMCCWEEGELRFVEPRTWKGQVPKEIHHRRVVAALSAAELARIAEIQPKSLQHNVLDAVGLGLWHLGRLK